MEKLTVKMIDFKTEGLEAGTFEGYGSTFGNMDFGNDVVIEGAFKDDLIEWGNSKQLPPMPWYHDMSILVGDWLSMSEDYKGLKVTGRVWTGNKKTNESQMVYNMLTGTGPKGLSIGFSVIDSEEVQTLDKNTGRNIYVRKLKKLKLIELSVVPYGMNPKAKVTQSKSLVGNDGNIVSVRMFEEVLREVGLSNSQAKAVVSGGYKALTGVCRNTEEIDAIKTTINKLISTMKGE